MPWAKGTAETKRPLVSTVHYSITHMILLLKKFPELFIFGVPPLPLAASPSLEPEALSFANCNLNHRFCLWLNLSQSCPTMSLFEKVPGRLQCCAAVFLFSEDCSQGIHGIFDVEYLTILVYFGEHKQSVSEHVCDPCMPVV